MPATMSPFDKAIASSGRLKVSLRRPTSSSANGGSEQRNIAFQLPPVILGDARSGEWDERAAGPNSGDQIAVYKTALPRIITMQWRYVVGWDGWTVEKIKDEIQTLRGYFRNPFIEGSGDAALSPLVIEVLLWSFGGTEVMSFRLHRSDIKHGKTLVGLPPDKIFALTTDVSIELKSWPSIGTPPAQTVPGQRQFTPDWF